MIMNMVRLAASAALLLAASSASADAFTEYTTNGKIYTYSLPQISGGYGVALDGFPAGAPTLGSYDLPGRLLVANGHTLYLQKNFGSSVWVPVATIGSTTMDPSFLAISPNGQRIAFGIGYGQPLLVFNASVLSASSPPNLLSSASVTQISSVDYYDAAWRGNDVLFVNGGASIGGGSYVSGVVGLTFNTTGSPPTVASGPYAAITSVPGASGGIGFNAAGDLVSGIGYLTSPNRTGEIKVWSAANVAAIIASPGSVSYTYAAAQGKLLANNILSAGALGFDADNNLHVGGGDAYGSGGASENGYGAVVRASVVTSVLGGGLPVNEGDSTKYKQVSPDPCKDDSATAPISVVPKTQALTIAWNPSGKPSPAGACYTTGSAADLWEPGVTPNITQYYPNAAPDFDGDGRPDGSDNAYKTYATNQRDTDGDGWGNIADCDLNNDGTVNATDQALLNAAKAPNPYNANADFNGDMAVNNNDQIIFNGRLGTSVPFY